jgi:hypothetical protein
VFSEPGSDRHVLQHHLDVGLRTVLRSITHPGKVVRDYGAWNVVRNELLPLSDEGSAGGGAWTANWGLHFFGSGIVSARMREWYALHGSAHPELAADISMFAAHLLNEITEASLYDGYREDPLPDLFLFDPLGMLVFHSPRALRLVSNDRVRVTNWQGQALIVLPDSTIENTRQVFAIKVRLPRSQHWSAYTELSLAVKGGLSYRFDGGNALTVAGGLSGAPAQPDSLASPGRTHAAGGATVYFDRDNSLLWSATFNPARRFANVNVYPGVVRVAGISPGVVVEWRDNRVRFGFASRWGAGLGLGTGPRRQPAPAGSSGPP